MQFKPSSGSGGGSDDGTQQFIAYVHVKRAQATDGTSETVGAAGEYDAITETPVNSAIPVVVSQIGHPRILIDQGDNVGLWDMTTYDADTPNPWVLVDPQPKPGDQVQLASVAYSYIAYHVDDDGVKSVNRSLSANYYDPIAVGNGLMDSLPKRISQQTQTRYITGGSTDTDMTLDGTIQGYGTVDLSQADSNTLGKRLTFRAAGGTMILLADSTDGDTLFSDLGADLGPSFDVHDGIQAQLVGVDGGWRFENLSNPSGALPSPLGTDFQVVGVGPVDTLVPVSEGHDSSSGSLATTLGAGPTYVDWSTGGGHMFPLSAVVVSDDTDKIYLGTSTCVLPMGMVVAGVEVVVEFGESTGNLHALLTDGSGDVLPIDPPFDLNYETASAPGSPQTLTLTLVTPVVVTDPSDVKLEVGAQGDPGIGISITSIRWTGTQQGAGWIAQQPTLLGSFKTTPTIPANLADMGRVFVGYVPFDHQLDYMTLVVATNSSIDGDQYDFNIWRQPKQGASEIYLSTVPGSATVSSDDGSTYPSSEDTFRAFVVSTQFLSTDATPVDISNGEAGDFYIVELQFTDSSTSTSGFYQVDLWGHRR